ncbi:MAG: hypothetical protein KAH18_06350 [Psychromonas sp.]|nr:hypothetical protein [Psychromonas sp.]
MKFIYETKEKYFILKFKSKRLIELSREDKLQGRFHRIDSLDWSEIPTCSWIKAMDVVILCINKSLKTKMGVKGSYI